MIWTLPLCHLFCATLNRPSHEPLKDWSRNSDSHVECKNQLDAAWHQSFSGVAKATRAVVKHHDTLDLDGCLVRFTSQPTE